MNDVERMNAEKRCLDALGKLNIETRVAHHPAVYTVEEAKTIRGPLEGAHLKNLFLCDRKKHRFFLVSVLESVTVNLKSLAEHLNVPKGLRFANSGHLAEMLGVEPGAVTPLAVLNDKEKQVQVVLDSSLHDHEWINAHPLHNAATLSLRCVDLLRLLETTGHQPTFVNLEQS
jgi:Ala-tRNA(Pro) deacylase